MFEVWRGDVGVFGHCPLDGAAYSKINQTLLCQSATDEILSLVSSHVAAGYQGEWALCQK